MRRAVAESLASKRQSADDWLRPTALSASRRPVVRAERRPKHGAMFLRLATWERVIADCTNMQLDFAAMGRFDADAALRALSHPHRRRMLQSVADVERSSSDLAARCRLSRPATSQHLRVLREADLVSVRADGNRRLYRARADQVAEVLKMLDRFWGDRLAALHDELESSSRRRRRR
jgi:DNA-binding transcriptional ArsR family regulator